jgi:hypothetical protein
MPGWEPTTKNKLLGADMVESLGALPPGESVEVDSREWCSLDDWKFVVIENGKGRVIGREQAETMFDAKRLYEVAR